MCCPFSRTLTIGPVDLVFYLSSLNNFILLLFLNPFRRLLHPPPQLPLGLSATLAPPYSLSLKLTACPLSLASSWYVDSSGGARVDGDADEALPVHQTAGSTFPEPALVVVHLVSLPLTPVCQRQPLDSSPIHVPSYNGRKLVKHVGICRR